MSSKSADVISAGADVVLPDGRKVPQVREYKYLGTSLQIGFEGRHAKMRKQVVSSCCALLRQIGRVDMLGPRQTRRCMELAMADAGVNPSDVDYINAHGTSTMADVIELGAVERMMGDAAGKLTMTSTKSATGHLLGAAGAIEAIFTVLAIRDQVAPPTINLDNVAVETPVDLAPNAKREREINYALSNSFGFGGTNASLLLGRVS